MNRHTITRTVFLAGLAISASVFAAPEIVKCVDEQGKVTLTDGQCPGDAQTVLVVMGNTAPADASADMAGSAATLADTDTASAGDAVVNQAAAIERSYEIRLPARRALPVVRHQPTGAALARDVATLKAARASLRLLDTAAQALRSQRLAGLN